MVHLFEHHTSRFSAILLTLTAFSCGYEGAADEAGALDAGVPNVVVDTRKTLADREPTPLGVDPQGIPILCGYSPYDPGDVASHPFGDAAPRSVAATALPVGTRSWEAIPSVIRADGVDSFRLEVDVNGTAAAVGLELNENMITTGGSFQPLRDDGLANDRVAGDGIYTSELIRFNPRAMPENYANDAGSPAGLAFASVGVLNVYETDGTVSRFLVDPEIGLLHPSIPAVASRTLASDVVATPHLVNVRTSGWEAQRFIRQAGGDVPLLTRRLYQVLADTIDFFVFFSIERIDWLPRTDGRNGFAGIFSSVRVDYGGTGQPTYDFSSTYGSRGRLHGFAILDTGSRGTFMGNLAHEILHQWASFTDPVLGIADGTGHYHHKSSAASLLGGFRWFPNEDGTFTRDCTTGRNGGHRAPAIDLYMMGLLDGSQVGPLYVNPSSDPISDCGMTIVEPYNTVTVADIQSLHGVRSPDPAASQKEFSIVFAVESHDRLLNTTELTFWETLAEHATRLLPPSEPDPYLGPNWVPLTRYFGPDATFTSTVTPLPPTPDLVVAALSTSATNVLPNGRFSIRHTVRNDGTAPSSAGTLTFHLSPDQVYGGPDDVELAASCSVPALAPGQSNSRTTTVTVPANTMAGSYFVCARVDSPASGELNVENNTACTATPINVLVRGVDLRSSSVQGPSKARAGTVIDVTETVRNFGNRASRSFKVGIYLSRDMSINSADLRLGERTVPGVAAGGADTATTRVSIPPAVQPANYYLGAVADDTDLQVEADESNNAAPGNLISVIR